MSDMARVIPPLEVSLTEDDWAAGRAVGATGAEVMARAIHGALDAYGVPRDGRAVSVTYEHVVIDLPPGWRFADAGKPFRWGEMWEPPEAQS